MSNVIDMHRWKRARLGVETPMHRRARPSRRGSGSGFVRIGDISSEIVRKLTE